VPVTSLYPKLSYGRIDKLLLDNRRS